jgi:peptide/nickel transport system substrate-binding protein
MRLPTRRGTHPHTRRSSRHGRDGEKGELSGAGDRLARIDAPRESLVEAQTLRTRSHEQGELMRIGTLRRSSSRLLVLTAACLTVLLAVLAGTALAASPTPSPSGAGEPVFKAGFSTDVDGINPFVNYSDITWEAFHLNYDFLTWYDHDYRPVPDLATSWTHTADGKVWTYTIRQGVKWSDGVPLTAADIAFTYNYILKYQLSFYLSYLENVTKVEAPNDTTLVITSSKPSALMLALYIPILPEHLWSKINGKKVESLSDLPTVGSGPFVFDEVKPGHYVKMTQNPYYWGPKPAVKTVLFNVYQDESSLVNDYKAGNLDVALFQLPTSLTAVAQVPGSKSVSVPAVGFHYLGMNCYDSPKSKGDPLLLDNRVRQAIGWAIDRESIDKATMGGVAQVGTSVMSPAMGDWYWQPPADQVIGYDPAEANQILDAAGYKTGADGVRANAQGKKLDFRLVALTDYPADLNAAKLISSYLKAVGIKTRLDFMSEAAFNDIIYYNGGVDLYLWTWGGDPDPGYQLSAFTTDQQFYNNESAWSNATYDKLYQEQATAVDRNQRVDIVHQMEQLLYNEGPYVVLSYATNLEAYRADRWTGWVLAPNNAPAPINNYLSDTYVSVKPMTASAATGGGTSPVVWVAIAVAAAVVVGLVVWLVRRRPRKAEVE